tara:strand:+ start:3641 stop:4279 length:639 start_codon:yes stop_codon:yes gene_type:complete
MALLPLNKNEMDNGIKILSQKDPRLVSLFDQFNVPALKDEENYFWSLCRSIIYQQISGKAAQVISERFINLFPSKKDLTPKQVIETNINDFYNVGLSKQKANYIKNIANAFYENIIDENSLSSLSDINIIKTLTNIKGVGPWTAEMFLIFTLKRPDVFPLTDLGIQKGFKIFFSMDKMPSISLMKDESRKWEPYKTIVSLYLWFAVEGPFEW